MTPQQDITYRRHALLRALAAVTLALLLSFPAFAPTAAAGPGPLAPVPQATESPASPAPDDEDADEEDEATPSPSPSPTPSRAPRPDPEGDRWVQLAVVGGGSLLGAVTLFMVIGGLIRWVNRRRARR